MLTKFFQIGKEIYSLMDLINHYKTFKNILKPTMLDFLNMRNRKYITPTLRKGLGPIS